MAHKVKMRKLFNLYNDFFFYFNGGVQTVGDTLKVIFYIPFQKDDLHLIYEYQRHLQEIT